MNKKRYRILLIEDDKIDQDMFKRYIENNGLDYEYVIAESVGEAGNILKNSMFNVILVDYRLRDGTAFDLFGDFKDTPFIIITGQGDENVAVKAIKSGAYDYLVKDVDGGYLNRIQVTVENAVRHKENKIELQNYRNNLEKLIKERTADLEREIIERKKTEKRLRKLEEKYRILIESLLDGIFIYGSGGFEYINPYMERIFGYGLEQIKGRSFDSIEKIDDEDRKRVSKIIKDWKEGKKSPDKFSFRVKTSDGSFRYFEANTATLGNKRIKLIGMIRDVTEQKAAEEKLRESEEEHRSLTDQLPIGIYRTTKDGRFIHANPALAEILGYDSVDELMKCSAADFYIDPRHREQQIERWKREGGVVHDELQFKTRNGKKIWIQDTGRVFLNDKNEIEYIDGSIQDITERKEAEKLQKVLYKITQAVNTTEDMNQLIESVQKYLGKVLDTRNFFVVLYDKKDETLSLAYFNDERDNFSSYPAGKTLTSYVIKNNKPLLLRKKDIEELARKGEIEIVGSKAEVWLGVPLRLKDEVIGAVVVQSYTDPELYTEKHLNILNFVSGQIAIAIRRKQAEKAREKIQEQLHHAQKMEAIGILAGGIAHDFNNMLTAIQGCTEMAMSQISTNHPAYLELKETKETAVRAADLTRQLLLFSRKHPMEYIPVDFNKIIKSLMGMVERLIGENIEIRTEMQQDLWTVNADRSTMEQVIMNLILNARDAMPAGGRLTIKTKNVVVDKFYCQNNSEARPGKFIQIVVEDTGTGIAEDHLIHIFEPFFSTKGPVKGTGLGLSVVYGILKQHKGWINVYSELGKGTTFKVFLPAIGVKPEEETRRFISVDELKGSGERILVVEDEISVREFSMRALRKSGYVVFAASDANEALSVFDTEGGRFDLIFSDVVLSDITGIDLVERLLKKNPDLKILLTSGYTDHKSQWPLIQEKGFHFLQKPYALIDLLRSVKEVIESNK